MGSGFIVSSAYDPQATEANDRPATRRWRSRARDEAGRDAARRPDLAEGYRAMAADDEHSRDALAWIEGLVGDVADEPAD
jgi:hypothetical protein